MQISDDRSKLRHVLRRFGLGASEAELDFYEPKGFKGAVEYMIEAAITPPSLEINPRDFANKQGAVNLRVMQGLWYMRFLTTEKPLQEKMVLFWHNHFATSAEKVTNPATMAKQIELFRTMGMSNFRDLLLAVSQDPAMIFWLDNQLNVVGKPNENFAREVMELFTLGIGHYTEKDIQEAARAFTGWGYSQRGQNRRDDVPRPFDSFVFSPKLHDDGQKTIFGKTGNFNGEEVIDMLCKNPQTARYLTEKAWAFFVSSTPNKAAIDRISKEFFDSGLEITVLVRSIINSKEFFAPEVVGKLIKTPIDFAIDTARQLGVGGIIKQLMADGKANPDVNEENGLNRGLVRALSGPIAAHSSTKSMGMELMYPPDVSGWDFGESWISTGTMIARMKWADSLFPVGARTGQPLGGANPAQRAGLMPLAAYPLFQDDPTAEGIVKRLCSIYDVVLSRDKMESLTSVAEQELGSRLTLQNANQVARRVSMGIFASPEFQFC